MVPPSASRSKSREASKTVLTRRADGPEYIRRSRSDILNLGESYVAQGACIPDSEQMNDDCAVYISRQTKPIEFLI